MSKMSRKILVIPVAAAILMMAAGSSFAQVELRWSPTDTTIVPPGGSARLSIHLDEALDFRTIEVTVTYDSLVVSSLGGGPGDLFSSSGLNVFDDFEEEPGSWHGFAIIMDGSAYLTGPGELLYWDIQGLQEGISPVITIDTVLYDEASPPSQIPDVLLDNALIIVQDPISAVQEIPLNPSRLQLAPNPFNPGTRISFDVDQAAQARLSVFDMRGHQLAVLFQGSTTVGTLAIDWNGTDAAGRAQPGGVYLFQLETPTGTARAKGILVK